MLVTILPKICAEPDFQVQLITLLMVFGDRFSTWVLPSQAVFRKCPNTILKIHRNIFLHRNNVPSLFWLNYTNRLVSYLVKQYIGQTFVKTLVPIIKLSIITGILFGNFHNSYLASMKFYSLFNTNQLFIYQ